MHSPFEDGTEPTFAEPLERGGRWYAVCRRLHSYVGLYFFFFLWLFTGTGLLLNHSQWRFSEFWANRHESDFERTIVAPAAGGDLAQAQDLMRQLGLAGEVEWTRTRADDKLLEFRISRPGQILEVKADFAGLHANVHEIKLNGWGILRILHTFTGVRMDDAKNQRDWLVTSLWALAMDATAAGTIVLVFTSLGLWWGRRQSRALGWVALGLGVLTCGLFCFGLRSIY